MVQGGSSGSRGGRLFVAVLTCLALTATPALAAEPSGDPPAAMYEPSTVDVIRLTLPPESKQQLEADPEGEYVEGTFSMATTGGTPGTIGTFSTPTMVGIRLKGKYGSYRDLAHKSGFKIKFNFENAKGEKGKKFLGLKKMTLNNMVQDTSQIHERLAYEAFRAAGVPSPRPGYAYLEVNGEDFGLHLNIETTDDVALEKRFGPFQHLYEGAYGSDVAPGGASSFEIDEGDEADVSDLDALISAVNADQPADFSDRVQPFADLVEMTRMWAVERYLGHWDGYTTKNNYYLVSDPNGRFQMLPWGADQTWVGPSLL
jgi:spore coat protein CotH